MTGLPLVAPILPLYAREFGVSRTAAGALISAFAVAAAIVLATLEIGAWAGILTLVMITRSGGG